MVVVSWLELFFQDALGIPDGCRRPLIETPRNITGNSIKASHNLFRVCAGAILIAACCRSRDCPR